MFFGVLLLDWLIIAVALCGLALVSRGQLSAPQNPAHVIVHLAFEALPPALGALLSATVVAVVVSTADSYLLSPASSVVRDVYQRFLRPTSSDREIVLTSRLVVVGLGAVALALAFTSDRFFEVALFAYTLYGAAITPPLLAALFWRGATPAGAVTSMLTGLATASLWEFSLRAVAVDAARGAGLEAAADFLARLDAALPAVLVSVLALVLVSRFTPTR